MFHRLRSILASPINQLGGRGHLMEERELATWEDFKRFVDERPPSQEFIWRGHGSARWELSSSINRFFEEAGVPASQRVAHEAGAIHAFDNHFATEELPDANDPASRMVAMQHFGCPTRLLDWTWSPYIAAYFALTEAGAGKMAIYCLDLTSYQSRLATELPLDDYDGGLLRWIPSRILRRFLSHESEIAPVPFWPKPLTEREFQQQSIFLLDTRLVGTTQSRLAAAAGKDLVKLVLPPDARVRGLSDLREMNIDGFQLFQGTGGVARFAREQLFGLAEPGQSVPLVPES